MCDECEKNGGEHKSRDAVGSWTRRGAMAFVAGAAVGMTMGFWSCQSEPKKAPGTLGAGKKGAAATTGGTTTQGTTTRAAKSTSEPATSEVITEAAPDLGEEVFCDARGRAIARVSDAPLIVIPRSSWTNTPPNLAQMRIMNGIERITVHHTAMLMQSDAWNPTAGELEVIREFHAGTGPADRHWADIAYHFVVDRAGRAWQARPLAYQGAHVKGHNEHNIGISLLGNFEVQSPSAAQLVSLERLIGFLRKIYGVPLKEVFTHGELGMTSCPGKRLETFMIRARRKWAAAEGVAWNGPTSRPVESGAG